MATHMAKWHFKYKLTRPGRPRRCRGAGRQPRAGGSGGGAGSAGAAGPPAAACPSRTRLARNTGRLCAPRRGRPPRRRRRRKAPDLPPDSGAGCPRRDWGRRTKWGGGVPRGVRDRAGTGRGCHPQRCPPPARAIRGRAARCGHPLLRAEPSDRLGQPVSPGEQDAADRQELETGQEGNSPHPPRSPGPLLPSPAPPLLPPSVFLILQPLLQNPRCCQPLLEGLRVTAGRGVL